MEYHTYQLTWLLWGVLTGLLAWRLGRRVWLWTILGAIFGLLTLITLFLFFSNKNKPAEEDQKIML